MSPDLDYLRMHIGNLVLDIAQARGIAAAAQQALAGSEKANVDKDARIAELEAEIEKLKSSPEVLKE